MICPKCTAPLIVGAVFCETCGSVVSTKKLPESIIGKTLLNQYVVKKKLGEGGFGAVYLAEQPSMGRKVAIKTLHQHMTHNPDTLARFTREGMVASRLEHPNAVKMFNLGETEDGLLWLAMEFLEGKTLDAYLKEKGPLSLEMALDVLEPVCEVLTEAHEKGVIHRDLKPDNIMLTYRNGKLIPRVMDFGIAGILGDSNGPTLTGMLTGTPRYMSPEQWRGLRHTDARSDIYALGIIAYQCLSGKLPFEAEATPEWMLKHVNTPPKPLFSVLDPSGLPSKLQDVIMKAIEKSPDDRYQTAEAFRAALRGALHSDATIQDSSLQTLVQPAKPTFSAAQGLALGLSFSFVIGLAFWFLGAKNNNPPTVLPATSQSEQTLQQRPSTTNTPSTTANPTPASLATKEKPEAPIAALTSKAKPDAPILESPKPPEPNSTAVVPSDLTREERAMKAIQLYEQASQLYVAKDYLEAQRLVEQANAFDSGFPELVRLQGLLYLANGQIEKACVHFQKYIKLVPGSIYERDIVMTMAVQNPKIAPSCTKQN